MQGDRENVLLDIYQRLGAIENELRSLVKSKDEVAAQLDDLRDFKRRVGAYLWVGSTLASGVLFFLWEGARYLLERVFFNHG